MSILLTSCLALGIASGSPSARKKPKKRTNRGALFSDRSAAEAADARQAIRFEDVTAHVMPHLAGLALEVARTATRPF